MFKSKFKRLGKMRWTWTIDTDNSHMDLSSYSPVIPLFALIIFSVLFLGLALLDALAVI